MSGTLDRGAFPPACARKSINDAREERDARSGARKPVF
tara:strand:- start:475 stop:588 length:114 start_codon:yes stop_codon:yes gene_type:complete